MNYDDLLSIYNIEVCILDQCVGRKKNDFIFFKIFLTQAACLCLQPMSDMHDLIFIPELRVKPEFF